MSKSKDKNPRPLPAIDPESRENQNINLAVNLAEQKLRDGTASNQLIVHYLKLGSTKERLEKEKLERENELLKAKTEALESAKHTEELYAQAIRAITRYSGHYDEEEYDGDV
jgi:hypothetical protein